MKPTSLIVLAAAALTSACASVGDIPTARLASATLQGANGLPAGTALITAAGDSVTLNVAAAGIAPGPHGIHLHMVGDCTPPGFTSAGGHLNPGGHQHGTDNPAGSHLGDLPNIVISSSGAGTLSATLRGTRAAVEAALLDADGTALVVHAAADDYRTDPTGNSGARIACGVLKRS